MLALCSGLGNFFVSVVWDRPPAKEGESIGPARRLVLRPLEEVNVLRIQGLGLRVFLALGKLELQGLKSIIGLGSVRVT